MKKLLLIAAASTALLTSAASFAETGGFYLKAEGGAIRLNALKIKDDSDSDKFKSVISGVFGVGAGYHAMDNVRAELTLGILTNSEFKSPISEKDKDSKVSGEAKLKVNVKSVLLSGHVDVCDIGIGKISVGAGAGVARVEQKVTSTTNVTIDGKSNTKNVNNFAYQLSIGVDFPVAEGVNLGVNYSWRDFGKISSKRKGEKEEKGSKKPDMPALRGHNLMAGIRFDL